MSNQVSSRLHSTTVDRTNVRWLQSSLLTWSADGQWIYFAATNNLVIGYFPIKPDGSGLENPTEEWSSSNEVMPALQW